MASHQPDLRACRHGDALTFHAVSRTDSFQRRYAVRMQTAHGRYPAATAVASSAKNTRRFA